MIKVEEFEISHMEGFVPKFKEKGWKAILASNIPDPTREVLTIKKDGQVMFFAGLHFLRPGVAEGWVLADEQVQHHKKDYFKWVYRLIHRVCREGYSLHRFQIAVDLEYTRGEKWARKLGLNFEGIARGYSSDNRDHAIYAKRWE